MRVTPLKNRAPTMPPKGAPLKLLHSAFNFPGDCPLPSWAAPGSRCKTAPARRVATRLRTRNSIFVRASGKAHPSRCGIVEIREFPHHPSSGLARHWPAVASSTHAMAGMPAFQLMVPCTQSAGYRCAGQAGLASRIHWHVPCMPRAKEVACSWNRFLKALAASGRR